MKRVLFKMSTLLIFIMIFTPISAVRAESPVSGAADPTYRAGGKAGDDGLTDNYIYTFANDTKDAAPGECLLMIDGQFTNWPVIINNDRALVPIAAVEEALGANVLWDQKNAIEISGTNSNEITMTIGQPQALVNGKLIKLDTYPIAVNGTIYLPIRFLCDYLDKSVGYLPASASGNYLSAAHGEAPCGLAYNPIVWVDETELTENGMPDDDTLSWLKAHMNAGLDNLRDNLETANRGYLKDVNPDDPIFAQIEKAINDTRYIQNAGRYAMFMGPYITLVDTKTETIYFYTTAHSLCSIWEADMTDPDTFVPMYFAD